MKTLIRLLLEEQSDLGLHCLPRPICLKTLDHYGKLLISIALVYNDVNVLYFAKIAISIF